MESRTTFSTGVVPTWWRNNEEVTAREERRSEGPLKRTGEVDKKGELCSSIFEKERREDLILSGIEPASPDGALSDNKSWRVSLEKEKELQSRVKAHSRAIRE